MCLNFLNFLQIHKMFYNKSPMQVMENVIKKERHKN